MSIQYRQWSFLIPENSFPPHNLFVAFENKRENIVSTKFSLHSTSKNNFFIMQNKTIDLFGLNIWQINFEEATQTLVSLAETQIEFPKVVVTPNVDHLTRLESMPAFKKIYSTADFIFADGMPVIWASRLFKRPLPERVTGADLFVSLCKLAAKQNLPIFILGGMPGEEAKLKADFERVFPAINVSIFCPSMNFDAHNIEGDQAIELIQSSEAKIVFVCLGMPKQENFAFRFREEIRSSKTSLLLCVGAAMEFALGKKKRAPLWMQEIGLEWLWRLLSEPQRLWRRYLVQGWGLLKLLQIEYKKARS